MLRKALSRILNGNPVPTSDAKNASRPAVEALEDRVVPSTITWVNRGDAVDDSDRFGEVFGAQAETARRVADAAIDAWERVITDFNYGGSQPDNFDLTLSMREEGTGFGAGANVTDVHEGKPTAGFVNLGRGTDLDGDGLGDGGWFLDLTPNEHSEFTGDIINAFAGLAAPGSAADGLFDLYDKIVVEMTHSLGITSRSDVLFQTRGQNTDTGITDNSQAGGVGTYFVFNGPSIDHLMTSNNGGPGGTDREAAVHGAGPGGAGTNQPVNFEGQTYIGAIDAGNAAGARRGQRRLVPNTMRLILQDAYDYDTVNPALFGTYYANLNRGTGELLIRGGDNNSDDEITVDFVFASPTEQRLLVSVDVGNDIPGTGPFSGNQDLPAFISTFDLDQVDSIRILSGDGNDTIHILRIENGTGVTIDAGEGTDVINIGNGDLDTRTDGIFTIDGGLGTDRLYLDDRLDTGNDSYTLTSSGIDKSLFGSLSYSGVEDLVLDASGRNNVINVNSLSVLTSLTVNGNGGTDTFNVGDGDFDTRIKGAVTVDGNAGDDILNLNDRNDSGNDTYTITDNTYLKPGFNTGTLTFNSIATIILDANDNNNTIDISGLSSSTELTVNGNGGNDTFFVGAGDFDTNIDGALILNGEAGDDMLNIIDTGDGGNDTYIITADSFTKPNFGTGSLTYTSMSSMVLEASNSSNTIQVNSLSGSTSLTLKGNGGNDTFVVTDNNGALNNIAGPLAIEGGAGTDALTIDNSGSTVGKSTTLTGSTVSGLRSAATNYQGLESLTLVLGSGNDGLLINDTHSGTTQVFDVSGADNVNEFNVRRLTGDATITGGNGQDTFRVGGLVPASGGVVEGVKGLLTVNGSGGQNVLIVDDSGETVNSTVVVTPTRVTGLGLDQGITHSNLFLIQVFTGSGNDRGFDQTGNAAPAVSFNLGAGEDGLVFSGTSGNDRIRIRWLPGAMVESEINGETSQVGYAQGETISVFAGAGNDLVVMEESAGLRWRADFHGESGNDRLIGSVSDDHLSGGNGNDLLWGGAGNDVLVGAKGNDVLLGEKGDDLLIGGQGTDVLIGGSGEDILIGGFTDYDEDVEALDAIMRVWTSNSYETASARLRAGIQLNEKTIKLDASTVQDDNRMDLLVGGADRDWYFARMGRPGRKSDILFRLEEDEIVERIGG